jgi:hypothetical protein
MVKDNILKKLKSNKNGLDVFFAGYPHFKKNFSREFVH